MSGARRLISDTELEVLEAVWDLGGGTVRRIHGSLREAGRSWAYNTVQTLLQRLAHKGFVTLDRGHRAHVYAPAVSREELLGEQLEQLADRICGGSRLPLLQCLVEGRPLEEDERRQLQRLVSRLEEGDPRREDDERDNGGRAGP
jgi:predicted transcriptional regulator